MVGSTYPAIPIPQNNIDSIYQAIIAMRQAINILSVNAQQVTNQTLTQAAQIFSKASDHTTLSSAVTDSLTQINQSLRTLGQSVTNLQTSITALTARVAALEAATGGGTTQTVSPATVAPVMDGIAAVGVSLFYARQDHRHPSDTSRLPLAGGIMTGALVLTVSTVTNAVDDTAAAAAGVPIGGIYRNGSVMMIRVT